MNAAEPVLVALTVPPAPPRGLVQDLVQPVGAAAPATSAPDAAETTGAGAEPEVLNLAAPDHEIADFLAAIVHTDTGFVARTSSGPRALAIVAATAAALCGEDIRTALAHPDPGFLTSLQPPAVAAIREVLHAIETDDSATLEASLAVFAR